jgi:nucleotide-binding universal stress UspA family protein
VRILCATRGGEASIRTQEAAIARAYQDKDELVFFYVVDVEFLALADYAMRPDLVTEEMDRMAEFLMTMAVERAESHGVSATYLIKHGSFPEQVVQTIREEHIGLLVLGMPGNDESAFKLAELQSLAASIHRATGVEVWIPGLNQAEK